MKTVRSPIESHAVTSCGRGRGVVAVRPFRRGQTVLTFRGPLKRLEDIRDFTHHIEVGPGLFLGPSGGSDDYVNHSCEPNCGIDLTNSAPLLRAIRRIAIGEELTYDYSTCMVHDPTSFDCHCGSPGCRGVVRAFRTLPEPLREDYVRRGIVPAFVLADCG